MVAPSDRAGYQFSAKGKPEPIIHHDLAILPHDGAPLRPSCQGLILFIKTYHVSVPGLGNILIAFEVECQDCGDLVGIGGVDGQVLWVDNREEGKFWATGKPGAMLLQTMGEV